MPTPTNKDPKSGCNSMIRLGPVEAPVLVALTLLGGFAIGVGLSVFWLLQQPWYRDPLIANAVQATVMARPTAMAPSVGSTTPTPAPQARIIEPDYLKGAVPVTTTVVVDYRAIPADRYLWVVVRVPKVAPAWRVFPQLLSGVPEPVNGNGTLRLVVQFGDSARDAGAPFNVVALLLDAAAQQAFSDYAATCVKTGNCPGIEAPATGVEILDFNTVVRQ